MLRTRMVAALLAVALFTVADTTGAAASTLNTRSDHAALEAYGSYLKSLIARAPIGSARDQYLIRTVQATCPGYLAPYTKRMTVGAGLALGDEVGGDLAARFTSSAWRPFRRLSSRLSRLQWSSPNAVTAVGHFINAERALIRMRPSNLCGDVVDLGTHPRYVGAGTRRFDHRLARVTANTTAALQHFIRVLETFEAKGDARLIATINRRYSLYVRRIDAVQRPARAQLLTTIGIGALS